MLVYYVSFLASRIGFERPANFGDLMQQVATRSHGWRENATMFAAAGLEKHGAKLFKPLRMGLKAGSIIGVGMAPRGAAIMTAPAPDVKYEGGQI